MTEKLYYNDQNMLEFSAHVEESYSNDQGHFVILDKTAFYPTSGGQLYDTGYINDVKVVEVTIDNNKIIHHQIESPLKAELTEIKAKIDRVRRLRHRQQHTAQHILSQTMHRHYDFRTVSVHLGAEYGAIEVTTDKISDEQLTDIEDKANQIVIDNLPVSIAYVSKEEAEKLPLRRFPEVDGDTMRLVKVGEYDYSACGGTHLNSSAEAMMIKIIGTEKIRGHVLVRFLCGYQILEDYKNRFDITSQVTKTYTLNLLDIPDKVAKLENENKQFKREILKLQMEMIPSQAKSISENAFELESNKYVVEKIDSFDKNLTRTLATSISEITKSTTILLADDKIIILADDKLDANQLAKFLSNKSSLKGGGNNKMAQLGGNISETKESITKLLKDFLTL